MGHTPFSGSHGFSKPASLVQVTVTTGTSIDDWNRPWVSVQSYIKVGSLPLSHTGREARGVLLLERQPASSNCTDRVSSACFKLGENYLGLIFRTDHAFCQLGHPVERRGPGVIAHSTEQQIGAHRVFLRGTNEDTYDDAIAATA